MIFFVGVLKFSFVGYKIEIEDGASPVLRGVRASPWGGESTVVDADFFQLWKFS